nr:MAG TPA: hypothetical protein [Herelleviridae sp.]
MHVQSHIVLNLGVPRTRINLTYKAYTLQQQRATVRHQTNNEAVCDVCHRTAQNNLKRR